MGVNVINLIGAQAGEREESPGEKAMAADHANPECGIITWEPVIDVFIYYFTCQFAMVTTGVQIPASAFSAHSGSVRRVVHPSA